MKKSISIFLQLLVFLMLVNVSTAFSQKIAKFQPEGSAFKINGTSNLHDWEESVAKFNVDLNLKIDGKDIAGIEKAIFTCKSASVASDNSIMTSKTHDALKTEKYPDIKFISSEISQFQKNGDSFSGIISGSLELAGVSQKVSLEFKGVMSSNKLIIKGTKKIKMSDYKIEQPTAMFGSLKTGDEVELAYTLQFQF
jgi:polyisoprenoid-binding protein YceI